MTVEVLFEGYERVEADAAPDEGGSSRRSRLVPIERALALAFEEFRFQRQSVERARSSIDADPRNEVYPSLTTTLQVPGVEEPYSFELVLDDTLFAQLVGLYSTFGWEAVVPFRTQATIEASAVAGVPILPSVDDGGASETAAKYLRACIRLLENLIYDAMVYLEQVLRSRAITALTRVNGLANLAMKKLRLRDTSTPGTAWYTFPPGDPTSVSVHKALTTFAGQYHAMMDAMEKQLTLRKSLKADRKRMETIGMEIALGALLASDTAPTDFDAMVLKAQIAEAEAALRKYEAVEESSKAVLAGLDKAMTEHIPAALPICLLVRPNDNSSDVANKLGRFYRALSLRADRLQQQIPLESRFVHQLSGRELYRNPEAIQDAPLQFPREGLESLVARTAMAQRDGSVDAQILSDADAIASVLDTDQLPFGSVEYLVARQYLLTLEARQTALEQARSASDADDAAGSKVSAALSLLTLVPGLQPLGAVATVVDVILMARFVAKSVDLLGMLELDADQRVLNLSRISFNALSEVAVLVGQRRRMVSELQVQAVMQLATLGAAQLRYIRGLLSARSYYSDMETLLGSSR